MRRVKITGGGQVSIPAEIRRRWGVGEVEIADQGDHLIIRPASDPIAAARGALGGVDVGALRRRAREDEAAATERRS